jgi:hypothetical protein
VAGARPERDVQRPALQLGGPNAPDISGGETAGYCRITGVVSVIAARDQHTARAFLGVRVVTGLTRPQPQRITPSVWQDRDR